MPLHLDLPSAYQREKAELVFFLNSRGSLQRALDFWKVADGIARKISRERGAPERVTTETIVQECALISAAVRYAAPFYEKDSKGNLLLQKYIGVNPQPIFDNDYEEIHARLLKFRSKAIAHVQSFGELVRIYVETDENRNFIEAKWESGHCSPVYLFPDVIPHIPKCIALAHEWFTQAATRSVEALNIRMKEDFHKYSDKSIVSIDITTLMRDRIARGIEILNEEYNKLSISEEP